MQRQERAIKWLASVVHYRTICWSHLSSSQLSALRQFVATIGPMNPLFPSPPILFHFLPSFAHLHTTWRTTICRWPSFRSFFLSFIIILSIVKSSASAPTWCYQALKNRNSLMVFFLSLKQRLKKSRVKGQLGTRRSVTCRLMTQTEIYTELVKI